MLLILQKCLDPSCSQSTLQSSSKSSTTSQSSKTVIKTFLKQSPGGVPLKISQTSQEYTCVRVSFLKKIAGPQSTTLLKKRLWHRCFPVNFAKSLRTPFLIEYIRWLLLTFSNEFSFKLSYIPRPPTLLEAGLHWRDYHNTFWEITKWQQKFLNFAPSSPEIFYGNLGTQRHPR